MRRGTPLKLKAFIKLMHNLGFIHLKSSSIYEEELLTDLWKVMGGNNDNAIKAENLMVILSGIMNLQVPEIMRSNSRNYATHKHFCVDEGNNAFFCSVDQIKKLH